jgi:membrane-associated phospholipid phosphatase
MEMLIKFLADGLLFVIILCGGGLFLLANKPSTWPKNLPPVIMAGLTSLLVGKLLSLIYQPSIARPFLERGLEAGAAYIDNPGFPSDHMLLAVVVTLVVLFMTPYKKSAMLLGFLAVCMGAARVMALVHTPLDIAGGIIAGLAGAVWYYNHRIASR